MVIWHRCHRAFTHAYLSASLEVCAVNMSRYLRRMSASNSVTFPIISDDGGWNARYTKRGRHTWRNRVSLVQTEIEFWNARSSYESRCAATISSFDACCGDVSLSPCLYARYVEVMSNICMHDKIRTDSSVSPLARMLWNATVNRSDCVHMWERTR